MFFSYQRGEEERKMASSDGVNKQIRIISIVASEISQERRFFRVFEEDFPFF
jgi:hypothetical protein